MQTVKLNRTAEWVMAVSTNTYISKNKLYNKHKKINQVLEEYGKDVHNVDLWHQEETSVNVWLTGQIFV